MTRVEEDNATSSVGVTQGIGNRYSTQGDGEGDDTCLICKTLLVIVRQLEQPLAR